MISKLFPSGCKLILVPSGVLTSRYPCSSSPTMSTSLFSDLNITFESLKLYRFVRVPSVDYLIMVSAMLIGDNK